MDRTILIRPESGLQFDWQSIASHPCDKHEPTYSLVAYKSLYTNRIAQARAQGMEPVLVSLPIMDEDRFFAFITRGMTMQERKNVLYWLGGKTERLRNIHALYNLALFRLAALQCVHIIDITSPMLSAPNYAELLDDDGVTLSPAGEALVNTELSKVKAHEAA